MAAFTSHILPPNFQVGKTLIVSPPWFYNIDSLFELVFIVVAFLISFFSFRAYRITKEKRYLFFSSSFFMMALAFILKVVSNTLVYTKELSQARIGPWVLTKVTITQLGWVHSYAGLFFRFLLLSAFLVLLVLVLKIRDKKEIAIVAYLLLIVAFLSGLLHFLFHTTLAVFLAIITYSFYENMVAKRSKPSRYVFWSFLSLFLSHLFFMFDQVSNHFYVVGEVLQLVGALVLLATYLMVLKK